MENIACVNEQIKISFFLNQESDQILTQPIWGYVMPRD